MLAVVLSASAALACAGPEPPPVTPAASMPPAAAVREPAAGTPASAGAAYLLVDRPSGLVLDAARAEELDRPVLPGSIAKIALLAAALEGGVVGPRTELVCRRDLVVDGQRLTCSHPDLGRPLSAAEALAHSCNSFFVTVASRVSREALNAARVALGLPPVGPTGPLVPAALGLAGPTVAPRVLAAALERAVIDAPGLSDPAARAILLEGLRGSAAYGTADALADLDGETYAKTGTAPMLGGGSLGLLVAWRPATSFWASRAAGLSLVVLAPGASGRDAAVIARRILEGATASGAPADASPSDAEPRGSTMVPLELPGRLRVGEVSGSGYRTRTIGLEDYVARAVSGEAAPGTTGATLEALAVTVRTYAAANLGRHADEGFDLCDLTHCQALRPATPEARAAAAVTTGRILTYRGRPAQTLYSASCGGWSATPAEIWRGTSAEPTPYLVSRAEPECREISRWTAELSARDLTRALRAAGLRGTVLRDLLVVERTASGRVARVRVEGFEPREISAEEFRLAVGRTLGWNLVKSHLFDVHRVSTGYRVAGFGAGHGVGLCLAGAARLGRAGHGAAEILADYFPGTALTEAGGTYLSAPVIRLDLPAAACAQRELDAGRSWRQVGR